VCPDCSRKKDEGDVQNAKTEGAVEKPAEVIPTEALDEKSIGDAREQMVDVGPRTTETGTLEEHAPSDPSHIAELEDQLSQKDQLIQSLQSQLTDHKSQQASLKQDLTRTSQSLMALKSSDQEKDSLITSLQLELSQLRQSISSLQASLPPANRLEGLTSENTDLKVEVDSLRAQLAAAKDSSESASNEDIVSLNKELDRLRTAHAAEIHNARRSHSRAAELQIENKTLLGRVEELKSRLVQLMNEKLELVERGDGLEREVRNLKGDGELEGLIEGQERRERMRVRNESFATQVREARGIVIDLVSVHGGCGFCTGDLVVL
jgi:chromosome segregation ATPase